MLGFGVDKFHVFFFQMWYVDAEVTGKNSRLFFFHVLGTSCIDAPGRACAYSYSQSPVDEGRPKCVSWGLIRTQVLYKGIWVWRTFHEEFEVRLEIVERYKVYQCKVGIPTVVYYLVNGSHFFLLPFCYIYLRMYIRITAFGRYLEHFIGVPKIVNLHFSQNGRWLHEASPKRSLSNDSLGREILSISIKHPHWWSTKKLYSDTFGCFQK